MKGPTNQVVLILNKDSLGPIEAPGNELSFGFFSLSIRVYRSDTAAGRDPSDKPAVEDITAELEEPEHSDVEHGYTSNASTITRDRKAMCQIGDEEEVTSDIASYDENAKETVVEGKSSDVCKDSADKLPHCKAASAALFLRLTLVDWWKGF